MAPPSLVSPVTGETVPPYYLHSSSAHFRDTAGRTVLLRGINLASSAKSPQGQPGAKLDGFWDNAKSGEMSFVGRVLDLEDGKVDQHLERLRGWGFNCLRYVINWESIEHAGPGIYDREYLDYTVGLLRKCKEHGFLVYIDPHQDLFSRFSGGSGAPYWTLLACGLEPENFTVTNAACIECEWPTPDAPIPSDFPAMIWASNYSRLACQTLFTLWSAGRDYAPKCIIDGINIQDWLQEHYFAAMKQMGNAIRDAGDLLDECVIGWDSLNEPNHGFLGIEDLAVLGKDVVLRIGPMPTPLEGMRLGMGEAMEVERWKFGPLGPKKDGSVVIDPEGRKAWMNPEAEKNGSKYGWVRGSEWKLGTCIWALHGVWDLSTRELLIPDYFDKYRGGSIDEPMRKVDFGADYWLAHWRRFAPVVREFHPEAIHFIQSPVFAIPPKIDGKDMMGRAVHSSHFYDGLTLVTKHWNWFNADAIGILRGKYLSVLLGVKIGETAIRKCLREQLGVLRQDTFDSLGQYPTMMGEIGIPFDIDNKKAYTDGDYSSQTKALDASLNACDGTNVLNYSIWTYCPDNSHEFGDLWNGEDLSLWSLDDAERATRFRTSTSQLDFKGKISRSRSRASSKASLITDSPFLTPNPSSARLSSLSTSLVQSTASLGSSITRSPSPLTPLTRPKDLESATLYPYSDSTATLNNPNNDPFSPINLNDGSRAIAAFCRPYPTKTVGTPKEINFDIRSSKFTLDIEVAFDDVIDPELPTEIYVPLIHYAKYPSRISQQVRNDVKTYREMAAAAALAEDGEASMNNSVSTLGRTEGSVEEDEGEEHPRSLALDVKVSAGRWETEGQVLRWYYPRPAAGQGPIIVRLELTREGGAIPAWIHSLGATSKRSLFGMAASICPPDCCIS